MQVRGVVLPLNFILGVH